MYTVNSCGLCKMTICQWERFVTVSPPAPSTYLPRMPFKTYHSVAGNVAYKVMLSLLLPHPPRGSYASLPPTFSRPSCIFLVPGRTSTRFTETAPFGFSRFQPAVLHSAEKRTFVNGTNFRTGQSLLFVPVGSFFFWTPPFFFK